MAGKDLRARFRSNDPDISAEEVFANREDEWDTVRHSLAVHLDRVQHAHRLVEDLEAPRLNVLVFYGVGGIGKTTLARRLTGHLDSLRTPHWSAPDQTATFAPVFVDLAHRSGLDFEDLVLSLRLGVGARGVALPAFDLAFNRYWAINHPGESLAEHLRQRGLVRRLARDLAVPEHVQSALTDIAQSLSLPGTLAGLVATTGRSVVRALREHRQTAHLLASCDRLADLLDADPDIDALSYYPFLLAWDVANASEARPVVPVIIFDTFEDVTTRADRDVERLVQRVAWLMPNSLFVITGRNRLRWDEEALEGQLDWVGPRSWPLLAPRASGEPRQHRVGFLSDGDCDDYLTRRLGPTLGDRLTTEARRAIVAHSHGLPLYLDLAVMRFLDLATNDDEPPAAEHFGYTFPALVARTFRDLTSGERQVLRAVSLLDGFSAALASAAAGAGSDGPVNQLMARPFVIRDDGALWPYHVHALIREAVRGADHGTADQWTARDWQVAAERTTAALGSEWTRASGAGGAAKRLSCLRQGLRLARDFGLELGWMVDAAYRYVRDAAWEPLDLGKSGRSGDEPPVLTGADRPDNGAGALAMLLSAVARRQRVHRSATVTRLDALLRSGSLPPNVEPLARYFLAECQRDLGDLEASLAGMTTVAATSSPLAADARRGLFHLSRRLGQFRDAWGACGTLGPEGRGDRSRGDVLWAHGRLAESCDAYRAARRAAVIAGAAGEASLCQACLAFATSLRGPRHADDEIAGAEDDLRAAPVTWATLQVRLARVLLDAGGPEAPEPLLAAIEADAHASGLTSTIAYGRFARCLHHAVRDDADRLEDARASLGALVDGAAFAYLVEISHFLDGSSPPTTLPLADWLGGRAGVAANWRSLVLARRDESARR